MDLLDVDQLFSTNVDHVSSESLFEYLDQDESSLDEFAWSTGTVADLAAIDSQKEESRLCVVVNSLKIRLGLDLVATSLLRSAG